MHYLVTGKQSQGSSWFCIVVSGRVIAYHSVIIEIECPINVMCLNHSRTIAFSTTVCGKIIFHEICPWFQKQVGDHWLTGSGSTWNLPLLLFSGPTPWVSHWSLPHPKAHNIYFMLSEALHKHCLIRCPKNPVKYLLLLSLPRLQIKNTKRLNNLPTLVYLWA